MPVYRYYSNDSLNVGETISLDASETRHMRKVVRRAQGDQVEVTNGRGQLAWCRVIEVDRDGARLRIESVEKRRPQRPRLILAQALPKLNRLDDIVEKGTELGVDAFWFFAGKRSEKQTPPTDHQMERLHAMMISALKQSGRLHLPEVEWLPPIEEWQQLPNLSLYGDVSPAAPPLLSQIPDSPHIDEIALIIGPEAGFSPDEASELQALGAQGCSLHTNILRADTAAIAALAMITGKIATTQIKPT